MAMQTLFLHPWLRKKRLGRSLLNDELSTQIALRTHYLPYELPKNDLVKSIKRCFKVSEGYANLFSAS
jgi:hypothetical protein